MCDRIFPFISFQLCLCTLLQTLPKFWKFSYMSTFLKLLNFSCTCTFLKICKFFCICVQIWFFRNSPIWCVHFKNLIFGKKSNWKNKISNNTNVPSWSVAKFQKPERRAPSAKRQQNLSQPPASPKMKTIFFEKNL